MERNGRCSFSFADTTYGEQFLQFDSITSRAGLCHKLIVPGRGCRVDSAIGI
jgi:hypothetical protein